MTSSTQAIADFWSWWQGYAETATELIRAQDVEKFAQEITPRIEQIDPGLSWETAPPRSAAHCLVVSAGGIAEHRAVAERWLRAAPPADEHWEFAAARPANPAMLALALQLDDHEFDLSHVEFAVQFAAERARFDISVYHPDFAFVDEEARGQAAFLALDFALGEDDVARWVGLVQVATDKPIDTVPARSLKPLVDDLSVNYAEPTWITLTGKTQDGHEVLATARFPMRRVDFPLYDQHVAVGLPYEHQNEQGFASDPSSVALDALEEQLVTAAGSDAVLVARQSAGGVHVLHFYADSEGDVGSRFLPLVEGWSEGKAELQAVLDPAWEGVGVFRT